MGALPHVESKPDWIRILALNLRVRRKALQLSQEELAARADIDVRYLGGIERRQENPTLKVIIALATCLACTPLDLLTPGLHPTEKTG
jgi:transcriptional regulator with XRE-family HTH domain